MFQPPSSVYYQKQQQEQQQQQQNEDSSSGLLPLGHHQQQDQQQQPQQSQVMKSVLGVIIPPPLSSAASSQNAGDNFQGGIKGSIAIELRSAASQDRHFFNQLRVARGKSLLLRAALVKKVKHFESRYGDFNEASFDSVEKTMDPARRERLLKLVPAINETVKKALEEQPNLLTTVSGVANESGVRRERVNATSAEEEQEKKKEQEVTAVVEEKKKEEAPAPAPAPTPAAGVPSWKARREAQQQQNQATAPTAALKTSKMFGLFKGALGNALKTQDATAAVVKQRQQIQDRTEKEAMLTDIGSMFHDYDKTVPKLDRLTEQSEYAAKVRAESTWFYKMCILEDDALAAAHFLQAHHPSTATENCEDAAENTSPKNTKKDSNENENEEDDDDNNTNGDNKTSLSSKYPPAAPSDAVFWLPAKHTPNSEQTLRNQLLRAVQRFETFSEEAKEFLMQQRVKRQVELTNKIVQEDTERGISRQFHENRQQGGLFDAPAAAAVVSGDKNKNEQEDQEEEASSSDIEEDFDNIEEEEDDPTMMM